MSLLGILKPCLYVRVSEHVQQIVDFIQKIEEAGLAYRTADGNFLAP